MITRTAVPWFTPDSESLRFLPEGPYRCPDDMLSWVAIQHGKDATVGSLNLLNPQDRTNQSFVLDGRPGFAFPTDRAGEFLIGLERSVVLYDTDRGEAEEIVGDVDAGVDGTIINDGVVFDGHLVFGCKDLTFSEKKAGLYLVRRGERVAVQLRDDQVCSNGKAIIRQSDELVTLYDICSASQTVTASELDVLAGEIRNTRIVVDLTDGEVFPDGMILTPDGQSLIIAIYDPRDVHRGEARQYAIATGDLDVVWECPESPRVTCPQLIEIDGSVKLLLTTADEGMSDSLRATCRQRGTMFLGDTDFDSLNDAPVYDMER